MIVGLKERKSTYFDVIKYCCKKMKKNLQTSGVIWMNNGAICIGDEFKQNINIDFCPFCGEKIQTELEKLIT